MMNVEERGRVKKRKKKKKKKKNGTPRDSILGVSYQVNLTDEVNQLEASHRKVQMTIEDLQ